MAVTARNTLKSWFAKLLKPTETQFANFIDSFFHLNEDEIPISKVTGLQDALDDKAGVNQVSTTIYSGIAFTDLAADNTHVLALNTIIKGIYARYKSGAPTVRIGTTDGGEEIMYDKVITNTEELAVSVARSLAQGTTIYIAVSDGTIDLAFEWITNFY